MRGRHNMLLLDEEGCAFARRVAKERQRNAPPDRINALISPRIPAIVRRQEQRRAHLIEVGFSSCEMFDGNRFRVNAMIRPNSVVRVVTPFDAITLPAPASSAAHRRKRAALDALTAAAGTCGIEAGLYGSYALELITSLTYSTEGSDLDICIRPAANAPALAAFMNRALQIGDEYGVVFDIEAACRGGFGVKLKELLSAQRTVLGKGLYSVELLVNDKSLFT